MEHLLVDVFFPATAGAPGEVAERAAARHLDAVIYVADTPEELPEPEALSEAGDAAGVHLFPGCVLHGPGFRALVVVPDWESANFDVLESLSDLGLMAEAVAEMGGVVVPVSPHTDVEGEVTRTPAAWPEAVRAGIVGLVARGKLLSRDLDIEEATRTGRPTLGASGPMAELDDVGRFATFLPVEAADGKALIASLAAGLGVAVEGVDKRALRARRRDKARGERDQGGPRDEGNRRRRRPRRGRRKGSPSGEHKAGSKG